MVAVWTRGYDDNVPGALTTQTDSALLARGMETVASVYDITSSEWSPVVRLSNNDISDFSPSLIKFVDSDDVDAMMAVWVTDTDGNLITTRTDRAMVLYF